MLTTLSNHVLVGSWPKSADSNALQKSQVEQWFGAQDSSVYVYNSVYFAWYDHICFIKQAVHCTEYLLLTFGPRKHHIGAVTRIFIMKILDVTYVSLLL